MVTLQPGIYFIIVKVQEGNVGCGAFGAWTWGSDLYADGRQWNYTADDQGVYSWKMIDEIVPEPNPSGHHDLAFHLLEPAQEMRYLTSIGDNPPAVEELAAQAWQSYQPVVSPVALPAGDGLKIATVQFKHPAFEGGESPVISAGIVVDSTVPDLSCVIENRTADLNG